VLKPVKMKKFYLAVQRSHEVRTLEEIGRLGAVQLISERASIGEEPENLELYDGFIRMCERSRVLLDSLQALEEKFSPSSIKPASESVSHTNLSTKSAKLSDEDIRRYIAVYEKKIDQLAHQIDLLIKDIEEFSTVEDHLTLLKDSGVDIRNIGDYRFIFVKVGIINNMFLPKLEEFLRDFKVIYETKGVRPRESILFVAAPTEYKQNVEKALSLLNFNEFKFPSDLPSDPNTALNKVRGIIDDKFKKVYLVENELREIFSELDAKRGYVSFLKEARSSLLRTKNFCIVQGWIPERSTKDLETSVSKLTNGVLYLTLEDPRGGEEVPVELSNRGLLKNFELLTTARGVPDYRDIDPTLIYAILFPVMYGMMFGDIGDGLIILVWGLLFYRMRKSFLGLSKRAINRLGIIMMIGGFSAMIFGVFYGSFFLFEGFKPLILRPTESFYTIVGVSLLFGVFQLGLALTLNIVKNVSEGEIREAIFSGKGVIGLIYYIIGVILAYRLILGGIQLNAFLSPENEPLTFGAIAMLVLVFLTPLLKGLGKQDLKVGDRLMDGFGEFIETFFSYITNSLSYIRLAAFAIAHGVLAGFALTLGASLGIIPSLIIVNIMVVIIEGFAAGIQSIRLIFYEFSTKFFKGGGIKFNPIKLLIE
jgi:V/A-type H+-transporting ATPase subunit I